VGFVMETALTQEGLGAMKVTELRDTLKAKGLDTKGVKKDLVARLFEAGAEAPVAAKEEPPAAQSEEPLAALSEEPPAAQSQELAVTQSETPAAVAEPAVAAEEDARTAEAASDVEAGDGAKPGPSQEAPAPEVTAANGEEDAAAADAPELPSVVAPPSQLEQLHAEAAGLRRQHQELTSLVGQWYQSVVTLQQQAARAPPPMAHSYGGGYAGYPLGFGAPPGYPGGYPPPPPTPQPSPWQEHYTAEGHLYYYNAHTGASSWERPPDHHPAKRQNVGIGVGVPKAKGPPGANLFVVRKMRRGEFDEFYDHHLAEAFERFGTLLRAEITVDKDTGVSKGFGFVSFTEAAAADAAMAAMNGAMVGGRQIRIEKTSEDGR